MKICFAERENSMNKRMIKALKDKCIYVDIDGTLVEYRFNNHVSAKDGTTNGQTMEEIENHVFLHSRPLKTVIKMLKKAKKRGIWICGAIISPIECLKNIGTHFLITLIAVRVITILLHSMALLSKARRIACGIGI